MACSAPRDAGQIFVQSICSHLHTIKKINTFKICLTIFKNFAPALDPGQEDKDFFVSGRPVPLEILIETFPSLWFTLTDN